MKNGEYKKVEKYLGSLKKGQMLCLSCLKIISNNQTCPLCREAKKAKKIKTNRIKATKKTIEPKKIKQYKKEKTPDGFYTTSEIVDLFGNITERKLGYWNKKGLVVPVSIRKESKKRFYSLAQLVLICILDQNIFTTYAIRNNLKAIEINLKKYGIENNFTIYKINNKLVFCCGKIVIDSENDFLEVVSKESFDRLLGKGELSE